MKKLIFLFLISFACFYSLKAQLNCNSAITQPFEHPIYGLPYIVTYSDTLKCDIKTPKGNPVVTWAMEESSLFIREEFDKAYILAPSAPWKNAKIIKTNGNLSSTRRFNCHGYAWLRVEQGIDRWIGTSWTHLGEPSDPEKAYITDGSYTKVSQHVYPGKVYWGGAGEDHSAVTTSHPDTVISKWNEGPLAKHYLSDNPFHGSSNLEYYVRTPVISGSTPICYNSSVSFSATNWQSGYYWDKSLNLSLSSTTSNPTTVSPSGIPNNCAGWVSVKNSSGVVLAKYDVWVGTPRPDIIFPSDFCLGQWYTLPYQCQIATNTTFTWSSSGTGASFFIEDTGIKLLFSPPAGNQTLSCMVTNVCGTQTHSMYYAIVKKCGTGLPDDPVIDPSPSPKIYPNPIDDFFTIDFNSEVIAYFQLKAKEQANSSGNLVLTFDIRIYDGQGNLLCQSSTKGGKVQFNVSNLPNGIYYLHIYFGISEKPVIRQIIVEH